jgi:hypothetical protein
MVYHYIVKEYLIESNRVEVYFEQLVLHKNSIIQNVCGQTTVR